MQIVLAPDSFKGTLSAAEAARAMALGIRKADKTATVISAPMADGGEGTIAVWMAKAGGKMVTLTVVDPLSKATQASYLSLPDGKAVIELAGASGLAYVPVGKRNSENALRATTHGTGELILHALANDATSIVLALGGSATTDGGFGLLRAVGAAYYDKEGALLDGRDATQLSRLDKIDIRGIHPRFYEVQFTLACDVTNLLCGTNGAAAVFGPQKGIAKTDIEKRDMELAHFATLLQEAFQSDRNIAEIPSSGAAGGAALPILAGGQANIQSGAHLIAEIVGLENLMMECDFVMTGEGRVDAGSLKGKVPAYVAELAAKHEKPCAVIAGVFGDGHEQLFDHGATHMIAASPKNAKQVEIEANAGTWLQMAAYHVFLDMIKDK